MSFVAILLFIFGAEFCTKKSFFMFWFWIQSQLCHFKNRNFKLYVGFKSLKGTCIKKFSKNCVDLYFKYIYIIAMTFYFEEYTRKYQIHYCWKVLCSWFYNIINNMTSRLVYDTIVYILSCRFLGALYRVVNLKIGRSLCAPRKILRTTYNTTTASYIWLPYLTESSIYYILA